MQQRRLGQELTVSILGLGCMGMSQAYGTPDDAESTATIHRALDLGITFIDTADMYGPFTNEVLVGKAIAGRRDEVVLATKFGHERQADGTFVGINGRPEYVSACCDASLKRLGVDVIDLYYQHRVDPDVPIEETWGAMSELVTAGKARYLGISEGSADSVRRAHAVHPISAAQYEYSLFTRHPEDEFLALFRELNIGFVAYSPLGRGFLTGQIKAPDFDEDDFRATAPWFTEQNFEQNLQLTEEISQLATAKGITPAQLAIAWVLAQGDDIVAIPGTKRRTYLEQNAKAADVVLSEDDLRQIDKVAHREAVAGDRYLPAGMARVNV